MEFHLHTVLCAPWEFAGRCYVGLVTQRDIAREAGVSPATVSRVINGSARVREDTRRRVTQAIRRLNYHPDQVARSLRVRKTQTVGFLVPDIANPFFPKVLKGLEGACSAAGYAIVLQNTDERVKQERVAISALLSQRVDGIVAIPVKDTGPSIAAIQRSVVPLVPLVLIDRHVPALNVDAVIIDNEGGAAAAVEYLIGLGHRRIGVIHGPKSCTPGFGRWAGAVAALKRFGLPSDKPYVLEGDFRKSSGYRLTRRLMELPDPPTALFVGNNLMTIGAYECLRDMGLRIPDDVSLVGFDDFDLANYLDPPITVVDRPMEEMGRVAGQLLLGRISGALQGPPQLVVLPTRLLIRRSASRRATA